MNAGPAIVTSAARRRRLVGRAAPRPVKLAASRSSVRAAASAGLVIAFYLPARGEDAAGKEFEPNAWLQIDPQGDVSLWVARSEMGQGVRTSMAMLVAEELDADWSRTRVLQADTDAKYGDMVTGGSASVRNSWEPLRKAGATGRELLLTAAATLVFAAGLTWMIGLRAWEMEAPTSIVCGGNAN